MSKDLLPGSLGGLKITKAQKRSPFLNMLIYGDSGIGKTTLAASAMAVSEMAPVLLIDYEGGTESLRHSYPEVDVLRVQNWLDMQKVYDELHAGRHPYKTVILDSLTEIQKFSMYQIMADLIAEKGDDVDPDIPGMREWGKNVEQIRRFVRAFRDLPMNTIFTALAKDDKNPRTGKTKTLPSLSGKVAAEVPAFLDVVVYYYLKRVGDDEQRLLLCNATEGNIAKDRTSKLPMVMESPTMEKLFTLILGKTETETDEIDDLTAPIPTPTTAKAS
jgi:phage nucleotide-binding protein